MIIGMTHCLLVRVQAIFAGRVVRVTKVGRVVKVYVHVRANFRRSRTILPGGGQVSVSISRRRVSLRVAYFRFRINVPVAFQVILQAIRVTLTVRGLMITPISRQAANGPRFRRFQVQARRIHHRGTTMTPSIRASAINVSVQG